MRIVMRLLMVLATLFVHLAIPVDADTKKKGEPEKPKGWWEQPFVAVIVRSGEAGCEPRCPEWIAAEGEIKPDSAKVFGKALKSAGKKKLPVVIRSPGGDLTAALAIGRMIRKAKLDVAVGGTMFFSCDPRDKSCKLPKEQRGIYRGLAHEYQTFCNSACPLILAAGTIRLANVNTYVGVHQVRSKWTQERITYREMYRIVNGKKKLISKKIVSRKPHKSVDKVGFGKNLRKQLTDYLAEMGLSNAILEDMEKAPPSSIYLLTAERRDQLKLRTLPDSVTMFTSKQGCEKTTRQNCFEDRSADTKKKIEGKTGKESIAFLGLKPGERPMIVVRVRDSGKKCEPVCPEWISAQGVITAETPRLFDELFKTIGNRKIPIVVDSVGGDFDAAVKIGKTIRARSLDVGIASTGYIGCDPSVSLCYSKSKNRPLKGFVLHFGECHGVCVLLLAAGQKRIGKGAVVVVNNPTSYKTELGLPVSTQISSYLESMGVGDLLLRFLAAIPRYEAKAIDNENLMKMNVLNVAGYPKDYLSPASCLRAQAINYCIER